MRARSCRSRRAKTQLAGDWIETRESTFSEIEFRRCATHILQVGHVEYMWTWCIHELSFTGVPDPAPWVAQHMDSLINLEKLTQKR